MGATAYLALVPIEHDHVRYAVGSKLALDALTAEPLLAAGAVRCASPAPAPAPAEDEESDSGRPRAVETDSDALVAAISELDGANPAHWTRTGKPQVAVLEGLAGRDVSSTERDAAWARYQATG